MTEKHKQVALQCRAITHMADALAKVYSDYEIMFLTGNPQVSFVDQVGKRTAALMETLGNILNGMDATDESDDWMEPVFREAQRLWPQPTDPQ